MLRIRTGYSFRAAAGKLDEVMSRLKEIGAEYAPITDRASTFGFYRWAELCKKNSIKPVFGVELAVTTSIHAKKPAVDYWTFIARDSIAPINRLVELATTQFRYQPLLTLEQALSAEGVFKVTGHRPQLDWAAGPVGNVFVALGPSTARGVARQAVKYGWPMAATSDNRYPRKADEGFYQVLVGRNAATQTYDQFIQSEEEWAKSIEALELEPSAIGAAKAVSQWMLANSNAKLQTARLPVPEKPLTLRAMCEAGALKLGCDLARTEYAQRLARELTVIRDKGFDDYFYIVADIVNWARERMIVGPARGSSCGSLVCWLLGITTIDPIEHGLLFQRFMDEYRSDLPDIDVDFADHQRHLVFDYIVKKYGREYVARLGTVSMFQPRSALQETGKILGVPRWECDDVISGLIDRNAGDARADNSLEDTLSSTPAGQKMMKAHPEMAISGRLEGHPNHYSQHAAGVIIASEPLTNYVAIDHRTGATMCDKVDAEYGYNLLKIDALGLTQLSSLEDALALADLPRDTLQNLPLNDTAAFNVLNEHRWSGIFQFDGPALKALTRKVRVDSFTDIVTLTALARPGPLDSGAAHEWASRRSGRSFVTYPHKLFEPFLAETLGVIVYQEQVMTIAREIGGLDWKSVTSLRKAMGKSQGREAMDVYGKPWREGAIANGLTPADVEKIWDDLCKFGAYGFNKSHSVAYAYISYWCCWLKAHFPFEFAAATLTHQSDPDKQLRLLREIIDEGYDYVPVDPDLSTDKWTVGERGENRQRVLIGPLSSVMGIGPQMMNSIMSARARGEKIQDRARKLLTNAKTPIDSLFPIKDAFKRLMPDPREVNIVTPPTAIIDVQIQANDYEVVLFCILSKITQKNENDDAAVEKRGYKFKGGAESLNLQLTDDTDTIFGKVNRNDFEKLGRPIVDRGRPGKELYAIKGRVRGGGNFRMVSITAVKHIGPIDGQKARAVA